MIIEQSYPPNFAQIKAAFPGAARPGVIFCYGGTIHNPTGGALSESLIAHERVHSLRQGDNPAAWWDRYIADPEFRFEEELAAHLVEYLTAVRGGGRALRRRSLHLIAQRLAGPLYGRAVSLDEAKRLIRDGSEALKEAA